jgi:2-(1,2-epoxy-1,2-dihydrophenyl)acetyl-CoA isomerase
MTDAIVLTEDRNGVRLITLNRPEVRNAIDIPLRVALAEALEAADAEASVRAIVLTGAGGAFCSGGDIATMERQTRDRTLPRAQAAQRVIRAIWGTPKPVVAAIEGPAFGAGAALALACDRVVAASDATFSMSFTAVGLAGDMGIFTSLPLRVGAPRARQMLMLPERMSGEQAHQEGLVDALVPPGTALERALRDAEQLARGPALALGVIKKLLSGAPRHPTELLELEVQHQADLFDTADFAEGAAAFKEKRAPEFGSTADQEQDTETTWPPNRH